MSYNIILSICGIIIISGAIGIFVFKNLHVTIYLAFVGAVIAFIVDDTFFRDINEKKYNEIYLAIKDRPELIRVLPNYTSGNCIINRENYNALISLINSKDIKNKLVEMPDKYKIEYVKKVCKDTVFSEKNLAKIYE